MFSVADVLDALTTDRPYRPACSLRYARAMITAESGTQFDPQVVEAFNSIDDQIVRADRGRDSMSSASPEIPAHGVLIVDDDQFIRKLIATTLEDVAEFHLHEAADGVEAIEVARRERPVAGVPRRRHAAAERDRGVPAARGPATSRATSRS